MKTGGIIAEYNPFHNGHLYQINKLKDVCDAVVIAMSGSFVQRGDVAVTDKFTRAKAAVDFGADLVVEIPVAYALSSAKQFAYGGVAILQKLGIDTLCFGAENEDISDLLTAAEILENETIEQAEEIKSMLQSGYSYPAAVTKVFTNIKNELLTKPNNILAVEYIRACRSLKFNPDFLPIKRFMTEHDSDTTSGIFASASHIRKCIVNNKAYSDYIPDYKITDIRSITELQNAIIADIRIKKYDFFAPNADIPESIKNKIIKSAIVCSSFSELVDLSKTKSVTAARIRRSILNAYLGIYADICKSPVSYIRVLAMNKTGAKILKNTKNIDIITKAADYKTENKSFSADISSTDIASLCGKRKKGATDYTVSPYFKNI